MHFNRAECLGVLLSFFLTTVSSFFFHSSSFSSLLLLLLRSPISGILGNQAGVISSYITGAIDSVQSNLITPDISINDRFPSTLSSEQFTKLSASCHSVWNAISNLLQQSDNLVHDVLASREKALEPSQMVLVLYATAIRMYLVSGQLAVHRSLEERLQVLIDSFRTRDPSLEELEVLKSLTLLYETAKTQALSDCRLTTHFVARIVPDHIQL